MNSELILFFRNIADSIEKEELNEKQMSFIGEFYMSYHFQNELETIKEEDFIKFLILGWYIYTMILKNDSK